MSQVEHMITRAGDTYNIRRKFSNGISEVWVTKRYKINGGKPGPFVQIDFLNTAVDNIRQEPDGEKSIIQLSQTAKDHLHRMGFCKASLERMLKNGIGRYPL